MKVMPQMASRGIHRWAVTLRAYEYATLYKTGKKLGNANALNWWSFLEMHKKDKSEGRVLLMDYLDTYPVTALQIESWTGKDAVLTKNREFVLRKWPQTEADQELTLHYKLRSEFSVQGRCIL